jgi:hypothetical protein
MKLINRLLCLIGDLCFAQRCYGEFNSFKLRSSVAGLMLPEFSKEHKPGTIAKAGDLFPLSADSFDPSILEHKDTTSLRNVGIH